MTELQIISSDSITPLVADAAVPSKLGEFGTVKSELVRRARKSNGGAFNVDDLRRCETLPLKELVQSITSEPDHPYFPLLESWSKNPSISLSGKDFDARLEETAAWIMRLSSVDGEIFMATMPPTLTISLERENKRLLVSIACPPALSPSIRLPTIHMPLATKLAVLEHLADILEMELRLDIPHLRDAMIMTPSSWMVMTIADLYRYVIRKGSRGWPADIPFEMLRLANGQTLRAEHASPPLEWLGKFLDAQCDKFGNLGGYVDGLQRLVIARYKALDDELPPSDVFVGLKL